MRSYEFPYLEAEQQTVVSRFGGIDCRTHPTKVSLSRSPDMQNMICDQNDFLVKYFDTLNVILVDFKLEFGNTADGKIVLADEISPDTCRLWDKTTKEKLDKDRFRRDLGGVEEAYQEIMKRVMGK